MQFISRHVVALLGIAVISLLAVIALGLLLISSNVALAQSEARVAQLGTERSVAEAGLIAQALRGVVGNEAVYDVLNEDEDDVMGLRFRLARALAKEIGMDNLRVVQACVPIGVTSHRDNWRIGFTLNPYASSTDTTISYGGSW